jgi:hypothetical protein
MEILKTVIDNIGSIAMESSDFPMGLQNLLHVLTLVRNIYIITTMLFTDAFLCRSMFWCSVYRECEDTAVLLSGGDIDVTVTITFGNS